MAAVIAALAVPAVEDILLSRAGQFNPEITPKLRQLLLLHAQITQKVEGWGW